MTLSQTLEKVAKLYCDNLWSNPHVLNYLTGERGLTAEIIKQFRLGYADSNVIRNTASKEGWLKDALAYGIVHKKRRLDFFNGYIILPVFHEGVYINLAGRLFDTSRESATHMTLPDLPKNMLYNLDATSNSSFMIVESPIDAMTLEQNGIHACATMGVAFPRDLLHKFDRKTCYILYDNDEAGGIGSRKLAMLLFRVTPHIHILKFPGKDGGKLDANTYFKVCKSAKQRVLFLAKNSSPIQPHIFEKEIEEIEKKNKKIRDWVEDKVDIVRVGRKLFNSKRVHDKGKELWVRCPNHKQGTEKTKSLWVGGKKNLFVCFGCNLGGGPIRMVSWHLKITPEEARIWIRDTILQN